MISSEKEEVFRILDFVSKQKAYGLQGLLPTVYIVSEE